MTEETTEVVNNAHILLENVVVALKITKIKKEELKFEHPTEFKQALNEVRFLLTNTEVNLFNLSSILKAILEVVDTYVKISATEKKQFALAILQTLIDEKDFGEEEAVLSRLLDNGSIGNMIDLIVAASHGDLNINNVVQPGCNLLVGCTKAWIPYCLSSKKKIVKIKK